LLERGPMSSWTRHEDVTCRGSTFLEYVDWRLGMKYGPYRSPTQGREWPDSKNSNYLYGFKFEFKTNTLNANAMPCSRCSPIFSLGFEINYFPLTSLVNAKLIGKF
jgi:hypothetical protein